MRDFKVKPLRDAEYLAFVRSHVCCLCTSPEVVPHHVGTGGTGQKTDDYRCVPLCTECHTQAHNPTKSVDLAERKAFFQAEIIDLLVEWLGR